MGGSLANASGIIGIEESVLETSEELTDRIAMETRQLIKK